MTTRRFNTSDRVALYVAADGRCAGCGKELEAGWHADHVHPWSKGGPTDLTNGQAMCPTCNLRKGSTTIMSNSPNDYNDTFEPREFQARLMSAVVDNHDAGQRVTVAVASPGSGKTLGYQASATELIRAGAITHVAVFAPRHALAVQCEVEYRSGSDGYFNLFDETLRLEAVQHTGNKPPLTPPGARNRGYVTTYQSLTAAPALHRAWAETHKGRFLLVGDEAQFLGAMDDEQQMGGTKAGDYFEQLAALAAHTVLLTGTEVRSDGQPIVLCDEKYETRADGRMYLRADVRSTYSDGIAQGYLRSFEAIQVDSMVERVANGEKMDAVKLSASSKQLGQVVRQPGVWQPLADKVVEQLRLARTAQPRLKALIACTDQEHARQVHDYLQTSGVTATIAVSEDGERGRRTLESFKFNSADVLVTVRMAFLGYDCKEISVVGLLTNYRDTGHLEQLVGRGLRVSADIPAARQLCRIVAPDDREMTRFIESLRAENDRGLQRRKPDAEREFSDAATGSSVGDVQVIDAWEDNSRAFGHAGSVVGDNFSALRRIQERVEGARALPLGLLQQIVNASEGRQQPVQPEPARRPRMTEQQQVDHYLSQASKVLNKAAGRRTPKGASKAAFSSALKQVRYEVNEAFGIRGTTAIRDADSARRYFELASRMASRVAA